MARGQSANVEAVDEDFGKDPQSQNAAHQVAADVVISTSIFAIGTSSVIGERAAMEDFVTVVPGFLTVSGERWDFFGIYDGHGSADVSRACGERMHAVVAEEAVRSQPLPVGVTESEEGEWWRAVMERSFERVDADVAWVVSGVGSAVVVAVIGPRVVVVANCGDCRAVMGRVGRKAVPLSSDHKPDRDDERERVERDGGWIVNWQGYRVLGMLAISRSLGDHDLKPFVSAKPEVTITGRAKGDQFLILASDGLWDVLTNESACRVVQNCLTGRAEKKYPESAKGHSADAAASLLTRVALSRNSMDNISVIVVQFADLLQDAQTPVEDPGSPFPSPM